MKNITKLLAAILALMLLTACAPAVPAETTTVPAEATTTPTTAPTTEPTTAPTTEPTTEPTTPPTEPFEEPEVPHAPGSLTDAEMKYFDEFFKSSSNPVNYYNLLLFDTFAAPEEANLERIFYEQDQDENHDLTDAEKAFLEKQPVIDLNQDVVWISASKMEATLQKLLGMRLEDMKGVGMEELVYFADTDCYYHSKGDSGISALTVLGGTWHEDGTVEIDCDFFRGMYYRTVTLRQLEDGSYTVLRNLPTEG